MTAPRNPSGARVRSVPADRALATAAAGDPTVTVYDDGNQTPACRLRFRLGADESTICYDRPIHT